MQNNQPRMQGKVCLITGATSGIGKATALGLANQGARVIMVARNQAKGAVVRQEIQAVTGNQAVDVLLADLSSQATVRQLAEMVRASYPQLDVLVNNAGVFMLKRQETGDGLEMTLAVNHLAPFLLTQLLLDLLKTSAPARIVNVCSGAHTSGRIDWQNLQLQKGYNVWRAYAQSKLAMLLCAYELARRLKETGVTVNCVHPGFVFTNMGMNNVGPRTQAVARWILARLGASAEQGAKTSLYVSTSPEVEHLTSCYFVQCQPTSSSPQSYDEAAQHRIWEESARLVHMPGAPSPIAPEV